MTPTERSSCAWRGAKCQAMELMLIGYGYGGVEGNEEKRKEEGVSAGVRGELGA